MIAFFVTAASRGELKACWRYEDGVSQSSDNREPEPEAVEEHVGTEKPASKLTQEGDDPSIVDGDGDGATLSEVDVSEGAGKPRKRRKKK